MNAAPRITSIGPPPERHASRIVDEMLSWMLVERVRVEGLYPTGLINVSRMGSPAGQQREVARLNRAIGALLLDAGLVRAKRGRFKLALTEWRIWDPLKDAPAESQRGHLGHRAHAAATSWTQQTHRRRSAPSRSTTRRWSTTSCSRRPRRR